MACHGWQPAFTPQWARIERVRRVAQGTWRTNEGRWEGRGEHRAAGRVTRDDIADMVGKDQRWRDLDLSLEGPPSPPRSSPGPGEANGSRWAPCHDTQYTPQAREPRGRRPPGPAERRSPRRPPQAARGTAAYAGPRTPPSSTRMGSSTSRPDSPMSSAIVLERGPRSMRWQPWRGECPP
jgi:hypothetical protein